MADMKQITDQRCMNWLMVKGNQGTVSKYLVSLFYMKASRTGPLPKKERNFVSFLLNDIQYAWLLVSYLVFIWISISSNQASKSATQWCSADSLCWVTSRRRQPTSRPMPKSINGLMIQSKWNQSFIFGWKQIGLSKLNSYLSYDSNYASVSDEQMRGKNQTETLWPWWVLSRH